MIAKYLDLLENIVAAHCGIPRSVIIRDMAVAGRMKTYPCCLLLPPVQRVDFSGKSPLSGSLGNTGAMSRMERYIRDGTRTGYREDVASGLGIYTVRRFARFSPITVAILAGSDSMDKAALFLQALPDRVEIDGKEVDVDVTQSEYPVDTSVLANDSGQAVFQVVFEAGLFGEESYPLFSALNADNRVIIGAILVFRDYLAGRIGVDVSISPFPVVGKGLRVVLGVHGVHFVPEGPTDTDLAERFTVTVHCSVEIFLRNSGHDLDVERFWCVAAAFGELASGLIGVPTSMGTGMTVSIRQDEDMETAISTETGRSEYRCVQRYDVDLTFPWSKAVES